MKSKRKIGNISLIISITGLILIQLCFYLGIVQSWYWQIVRAGFEAATVGGFADWFAVSALFREIPIPVLRKHTDILVKNRNKLTEGVVELVTTEWLAPEVIRQKIEGMSISYNIIELLKEPQNKARAIEFIKDVLKKFISGLDSPQLATFLQAMLKDQVSESDLSAPLGRWLQKAIRAGDHNQLWDLTLSYVKNAINNDSTRALVLDIIAQQIKRYKREGTFKKIFINVVEFVDALNEDVIATNIIEGLNQFVEEAENNPDDPFRQKFDESLLDFAHSLIHHEEKVQVFVDRLKKRVLNDIDLQGLIFHLLIRFKNSMEEQLGSQDTTFMMLLQKNINNYLNELETDDVARQRIDKWLKESICQLVDKYHSEIGDMVRTSLSALKDVELVEQIENKVGDDLQYIRLNGAVVGGLVGMIIESLHLIIMYWI